MQDHRVSPASDPRPACKTLILNEDTYEMMVSALEQTDAGSEVLARFARGLPKLPATRELVAMARAGEPAPAAITIAVAQRDAGRRAADDTREQLERLLHHVHGAGVQPTVLKSWFGYTDSRLFQLLKAEKERRQAKRAARSAREESPAA